MILTNPYVEHPNPRFDVETLIRRHGLLTVLRSIVAVAVSRRNRPPPVDALPNHLRRDIGLEVRHERPLPPGLMR
jgi:hypothetical protein